MATQNTAADIKELGRKLAAVNAREDSIRAVISNAETELASLSAQREELHRMLARLAIESAGSEPEAPPPAPPPPPPARPLASSLPPLKPGTRGQGERLLALLQERPGAPQSWLAEKLYGDAKATARLSSLLDYLRKTGKARAKGDGTWEAVS
jgi:hypothetical protein